MVDLAVCLERRVKQAKNRIVICHIGSLEYCARTGFVSVCRAELGRQSRRMRHFRSRVEQDLPQCRLHCLESSATGVDKRAGDYL